MRIAEVENMVGTEVAVYGHKHGIPTWREVNAEWTRPAFWKGRVEGVESTPAGRRIIRVQKDDGTTELVEARKILATWAEYDEVVKRNDADRAARKALEAAIEQQVARLIGPLDVNSYVNAVATGAVVIHLTAEAADRLKQAQI